MERSREAAAESEKHPVLYGRARSGAVRLPSPSKSRRSRPCLSAPRCCRRRVPPAQPWFLEGASQGLELQRRPDLDFDAAWLGRFPLSTSGRHVVDRLGARFKLAGINWYGASCENHVVGGLDVQRLEVICETVHSLGFSVVRLSFSNEMLHRKPAEGSIDFQLNPRLAGKSALEVLDEVVLELGARRVAVILNNHTTFGRWCGGPDENGLWRLPRGQAPWGPQTEKQWIEDWAMLALRYQAVPHVVGYDLRNEVRAAPFRAGLFPWMRWPVFNGSAAGRGGGGHGGGAGGSSSRQQQQQQQQEQEEEECALLFRANWAEAAVACCERLQGVRPEGLLVVERIVWPQHGLCHYSAEPGPLLPRFRGKLVLAVHSYSWTAPGRYVVQWGVPTALRPLVRLLAATGVVTWKSHGEMAQREPAALKRLMMDEWGYALQQGLCPVWVSEFGSDRSESELQWLTVFVGLLKELDADWAYWPLNVGDKPAGGGPEPYGMLTSSWEPPPQGTDPRLDLLQSIMH